MKWRQRHWDKEYDGTCLGREAGDTILRAETMACSWVNQLRGGWIFGASAEQAGQA